MRFWQTSLQDDLDRAVVACQDALRSTPADHPGRAARLNNLGVALKTRFGRTGDAADLDNAIDVAQQSVDATRVDHTDLAGHLKISAGNFAPAPGPEISSELLMPSGPRQGSSQHRRSSGPRRRSRGRSARRMPAICIRPSVDLR